MSKKLLAVILCCLMTFFLIGTLSINAQDEEVSPTAAPTQAPQNNGLQIIFDILNFFDNLNNNPGGGGPTSGGSSPLGQGIELVNATNVRGLLAEAEAKIGVPAKILEAHMIVETSMKYFNLSAEQVQAYSAPGAVIPDCEYNGCSAVGPMQMTVGKDPQGRTTCPDCGSIGFCPNAWATYGNAINEFGGYSHQSNPCNLRDNIFGSAAKLRNDSGAVSLNWTQQQVTQAVYRYYGNCGDIARARFNGRNYCEYVWWYYSTNQ